jgi:hypothetical protein
MQSQGVGAPPNEITVFPIRSDQAKLGCRLPAQQEEAVAVVDVGEVNGCGPAAIGDIEAAHDPRQRHVRGAALERGRQFRRRAPACRGSTSTPSAAKWPPWIATGSGA